MLLIFSSNNILNKVLSDLLQFVKFNFIPSHSWYRAKLSLQTQFYNRSPTGSNWEKSPDIINLRRGLAFVQYI